GPRRRSVRGVRAAGSANPPLMDWRYWTRAGRAFGSKLRHREFVRELARLSLETEAATEPALPPLVDFFDAYPEASGTTVSMGHVTYKAWNMDPLERF